MTNIAFIFPGQGSQAVGMGQEFYETYAVAKQMYEKANDLLGFDLTKVMFEGPKETLNQTLYSQLSIYVNSLAILEVLKKHLPELQPSYVAGLSLGEYTAMTASGRLSFEDGIELVRQRALLMEQACLDHPGTMAALIGVGASEVEALVEEINLPDQLWIANYNSPQQLVISGTHEAVEACIALAKEKKIRAIQLKVQGAFHSGLMRQASHDLQKLLEKTDFKESATPILMNVTGHIVSDLSLIKKYLGMQVTESVKWEQSIREMDSVDLFIEIGQGKVLSGLNQKIGVTAPTLSIGTVEELKNTKENLDKVSHEIISS